jgi:hypothetical protein
MDFRSAANTSMKKILAPLFCAVALVGSLFANSANQSPITYSVSLLSSAYNATANTTTFTYSMTSGTKPAISHWVIAISPACGGREILVGSNDPLVTWVNSDPTTGVRGIKFDTGYDDGQTRLVTLTLAGQWGTGEVGIAVKSGNDFVLGMTQGPVCASQPPPQLFNLNGTVFFDANYNGSRNPDEIGIGAVPVTLLDASGSVHASTTTAADGAYRFTGLPAGSYTVVVGGVNGMLPTTLTEHDLVLSADRAAPDTGYGLDFAAIGTMSANGYTIGFWKNNLEKALKGTTKGVQLSAATLAAHTVTVGGLALEPFASLTMSGAVNILSATGSAPTTLLSKQLIASEYNYANGAHLNGDARLTYFFIHYGEYVLKNASGYSSSFLLNVKDWFDSYNNTHGGLVVGPLN